MAQITTNGASTGLNVATLNATPLNFLTNGTSKMVITSGGNVGIGTGVPDTKLHVVSTVASSNRYNLIDGPVPSTISNVILALRNTSPLATGNYSLLGFTNAGPTIGGAAWGVGSVRTGATATGGSEEDFFVGNSLGGGYIERMRITNAGNVGIGVTDPSNRLHINAANPLRLQGITAGVSTTDPLLVVDANGVVKSIGTLSSLSIPNPAVFRLETSQVNFLNGVVAGGTQVVPMSVIKNSISGLTYNAGTSTITFPAGTYQMTIVTEATHNNTGCTLSSYFVDFPLNAASTVRVHSTASHVEGSNSIHGNTITYATTVPANRTWTIALGRGVSGNCSGTGMSLAANSTQLLIYRIGD